MPKSKLKTKKSPRSKKQSETVTLTLKQQLAQKRKAREIRTKLISVFSICLFFALAVGLPISLLINTKVGVVVGVGIPSLVLSYSYPRQALWFFLIYMPFSGTVTYSIGGGSSVFQLAKDVFYIPALLGLVLECSRKRKPIFIPKKLMPSFWIILAVSLIVLLVVNGYQQFLPHCDSLEVRFLPNPEGGLPIRVPCRSGIPFLQGLLGFKVLLGYVPLIFCAYYLIEDKKELLFFGRLMVVIAIICCSLGIVQYWMLDSGRCIGTRGKSGDELFRASLEAKCLVGGSLLFTPEQGVIRLPGTFVSPWHWAWFLIGNSALTFTTAFSDPSWFWRMGGLAGMALVMVNAVICGQRIALAVVPTMILVLLILTGQIRNFKRFIPIALGLTLILGFAIINNPDILQERINSLILRWQASPPTAFMREQFDFAFRNTKGLLGRGLGAATNSTRIFGPVSLVETFHPKLIFEIGYLGTLVFMIFVTHLTILSLQDYLSLKDKTLRSFASCFWVFILIIGYFPYWYPLDTDPVAVYYWLLAGIIFKLPVIEQRERKQLKLTQGNESSKKRKNLRQRNRQVA